MAVSAFGQTTGGFFNPARFLGPALVFGCNLHITWIYLPAQFFGGILAGLMHSFVMAKEPEQEGSAGTKSKIKRSLSYSLFERSRTFRFRTAGVPPNPESVNPPTVKMAAGPLPKAQIREYRATSELNPRV